MPVRLGPGEVFDGPIRYFVDTTWSCETFGGVVERHYVFRKGPYAYVLRNLMKTPAGRVVTVDEYYHFDTTRRRWTVSIAHGAFRAVSTHVEYSDFVFRGEQTIGGVPTAVRMHFHMYDDVLFRRDFETLRAGSWTPFSGETCERYDFLGTKF